ncbi:MAG: eCIS core domain-containing protein [Thermoanaerobaculia bacterium]
MPSPLPPLPSPLSAEIARAGARIRIGFPLWLRPLLLRGVVGITLGRRIFLAPELLGRGEARLEAVIRHELAHVDQVRRLGLVRFLAAYVREYLALRLRGLGHVAAYRAISFEREARAAERDHGERGPI